jgi:hypothetical protein
MALWIIPHDNNFPNLMRTRITPGALLLPWIPIRPAIILTYPSSLIPIHHSPVRLRPRPHRLQLRKHQRPDQLPKPQRERRERRRRGRPQRAQVDLELRDEPAGAEVCALLVAHDLPDAPDAQDALAHALGVERDFLALEAALEDFDLVVGWVDEFGVEEVEGGQAEGARMG